MKVKMLKSGRCPFCTLKPPCKHFEAKEEIPVEQIRRTIEIPFEKPKVAKNLHTISVDRYPKKRELNRQNLNRSTIEQRHVKRVSKNRNLRLSKQTINTSNHSNLPVITHSHLPSPFNNAKKSQWSSKTSTHLQNTPKIPNSPKRQLHVPHHQQKHHLQQRQPHMYPYPLHLAIKQKLKTHLKIEKYKELKISSNWYEWSFRENAGVGAHPSDH